MKKIFFIIIICALCICTSTTDISDGSITITTNGLVTIENDKLCINVDVIGQFELHIKDITGQSIFFISGMGPAEFKFLASAFKFGMYWISVRDVDGNIIYKQKITI